MGFSLVGDLQCSLWPIKIVHFGGAVMADEI